MIKTFFNTLRLSAKVALAFLALGLAVLTWMISQFPTDKEIKGCLTTKLYAVELCPTSKNYVPLRQVSENLIKALILTEDSSFYQHHGFDFQEMENSFKANLEKKKFARGGSTISQQLAKNLFLSKDKTIQRKILEALITMRMEKVLSKKEILEKYVNVVQFGKDLYGVKAASAFYFKKMPSELSINEAAFLVFLLPSPEKYSRSYFKGTLTPFARQRMKTIIERLFTYERISKEQFEFGMANLDSFIRPASSNGTLQLSNANESDKNEGSRDQDDSEQDPLDETEL